MMNFLVISDHSIMMDGIISRLSSAREDVVFHVGNRTESLISQVSQYHPDVVIIDKEDINDSGYCSLNALFNAYPNMMLVEIDQNTAELQIIGSQQIQPKGFSDLMQYLVTVSSNEASFHNSVNLGSI
jgi:DNA-binding NarL/FixJ family response regulator